MLVIGLTGNIGCGKSSLSKILKDNSLDIIDADIISREIMSNNKLLEEVFQVFGEDVKDKDGTLNRKKLASIVFSDDKRLIALNDITHPAIKNEIKRRIKDIENKGRNIVIVDAALLIEGKFLDLIDKLIVITCDEKEQLNRVMDRDNSNMDEALNRISSQMSQDEKVKFGDYIIDNSGSLEELNYKANKLITYIKENWCE
ncbi:dephospho-CoA kinase [[Clostridium] sordellii]|uniref:Dephospho-CoA kinase n=1 Tax=Paraclostridium sordellii TaxID=1505 RepID=A0ABM9RKX3_PARSO|nr:dephospho-CoA kinase [Paeniclostridium sordellii]CEJ72537.1 Dephospho-CoA kinase (Dephosphocoenzyme A kinase) [[Clostridium] sordellii] [Paeniclostridium sordellii]CEN68090.1 dephospho-CoA kinase [[Clostridium] sordellii] [Paeniclostridium sordellii]CEN71357.1 dephospho-CoA kinase [[Clostridium] sordellii] [Paeniclostridium sordellii]CEO21148.1 dephospho-CoA kinase [[Clostridium] sordellii] [Paeniclostridium sordellii]CEP77050.1 dephospho-CoA kinase [[Clostridium] sordellii] [Paeniclostridi